MVRAQIFTVVSGGRFLGLPMESLLVEEEVLWRPTKITTEKRHNFLSDRWIALKYLQ